MLNHSTLDLDFQSNLRLGVMGPAAGGKALQQLVHDWIDSPQANGWDYQISNGIIVNYDLLVKYPVVLNPILTVAPIGIIRVGTLFDDVATGLNVMLNNRNFKSLSEDHKKKFSVFFSTDATLKFVAYNATLQGGLFLKSSQYLLAYSEVTPLVFSLNTTIGVRWYGILLSYGHNYLTREFYSGDSHNYSNIKLGFNF